MNILIAVLFFSFLIFIHELGHFIVARLCGVKVLEFAIGMGPKLFSIRSKKSGTVYAFRLLPLGGFVNMLGESGMEAVQGENGLQEGEESDPRKFFTASEEESEESEPAPTDPELEKQSYRNQSVWKRILISVAGPLMNVILGFLLMLVLVLASKDALGTTVVESFPEGATSINVGLAVGDEVIKVGDSRVHTLYELAYEISEQGNRPVDLVVLRNGERVTIPGVSFPVVNNKGIVIGLRDFYVLREQNINLFTLVKHSFWRSVSCVKMVYDSIEGLFTGRYGMEAVSGPVGIAGAISEASKTGPLDLLHLLILISINLGVMNLLPLPALDGGHILIYLIEAIRRKPLKPEVEGIINFIGLVLLLGLAILISIKDVIAL